MTALAVFMVVFGFEVWRILRGDLDAIRGMVEDPTDNRRGALFLSNERQSQVRKRPDFFV
jgi:hypothetical protein